MRKICEDPNLFFSLPKIWGNFENGKGFVLLTLYFLALLPKVVFWFFSNFLQNDISYSETSLNWVTSMENHKADRVREIMSIIINDENMQ